MDKAAPGAIRPPSLDLWSGVVLRSMLDAMRADDTEPQPVFFLGDAADISCTGEFQRFLDIMRDPAEPGGKELPWFGVLGNHDGFYEGNVTKRPDLPLVVDGVKDPFQLPNEDKTWSNACWEGRERVARDQDRLREFERSHLIPSKNPFETHVHQRELAKATAVLMYLGDLRARELISVDPLEPGTWNADKAFDEEKRFENILMFSADGKYQLGERKLDVSVRASITPPAGPDDDRQWRGFVVQDVQLPDGTHVLLVDTSDQVKTPPSNYVLLLGKAWQQVAPRDWLKITNSCHTDSTITFPGACGMVSPKQMEVIRELMGKWPKGTRYFVMGHHPLGDFRLDAASLIGELFTSRGFIGYVSGHTHYSPSTAPALEAPRWEVNIGSTTDAPMQYSRLSYWTLTGAALQLEVLPPTSSGSCPYDDAGAELDYQKHDNYLKRALVAYQRLLDSLSAELVQTVDERARTEALSCATSGCVSHYKQRAAVALASGLHVDRRRALSDLVEFDTAVLQDFEAVRAVESACAIWASGEDDRARHSPRPTIHSGEALPFEQPRPFRVTP